jgi:hypothetical protein
MPPARSNAVNAFLAKHSKRILGVVECFDRLILRGHLPMAAPGYFSTWLYSKKIALNLQSLPEGWWNFKDAAPWFAGKLKGHAKELAAAAQRPYVHLPAHQRMEESARALAAQDGIEEGLVCAYGTNETCRTFRVHYGDGKPTVRPDLRVCLHIYFYWMDREFGLLHVKLQTWFPFTVQVYVNGHEWLAQKLSQQGIAFRQVDNAFTWLADPGRASDLARGLCRRDWAKFLQRLASRVNPLLGDLAGGPELLLGGRSGRVVHRCAVRGQGSLGDVTAALVRTCRSLFWGAADHGVSGAQVSRELPGRSQNDLAPTRARRRGQALAEAECLEDVRQGW